LNCCSNQIAALALAGILEKSFLKKFNELLSNNSNAVASIVLSEFILRLWKD